MLFYLLQLGMLANLIRFLGENTEREGFEPSVNKSLHSSSNATPSTTRPSLLHTDYDSETEKIASHAYVHISITISTILYYSILVWLGTTTTNPPIL